MAPVLGYWKIRGLGQHIRLLLTYTGTEFEDKLYEERPLWLAEKNTLDLDFPNLPYYIDGDVKMTQSNAIMRHLARKHNLDGRNEKENIQLEMLEGQAMDLRLIWAMLCYFNYDEGKEEYPKKLPEKLKPFADYLGTCKWFLGDRITYVDFIIYELLDIHLYMDKTCLDQFQNLKDYHKQFQELPAIKTYMASPQFIKYPINGDHAKFGA